MASPAVTKYAEEIAEAVNEMTTVEVHQFARTLFIGLNEDPFEAVIEVVQDLATADQI